MFRSNPGLCWLIAALAVAGCDQPQSGGPDGGVDSGVRGQGSPPTGLLVVNEVAPRPADGPDWLELENRSDQTIDLCDYFVTDSIDRLDHYLLLGPAMYPDRCEPRPLAPGAYLVVYADDDPDAGPGHAPFQLGVADAAHVIGIDGLVVDSFIYLYPQDGDGRSLARSPDGEGLFYLAEPTPGAANPELAP